MAIHHDKTAYGKLASTREDLSEEQLSKMLKALSETADAEKDEKEEKVKQREDKAN